MDNILGIAGSGCGYVGITSGTTASEVFDSNVWVLLVIPFLFFVLTFVVKGNLERLLLGVITLIASGVMLSSIISNYDTIYAVPLMLMIFGICIKIVKESVQPGRA